MQSNMQLIIPEVVERERRKKNIWKNGYKTLNSHDFFLDKD